MVSSGKITWRSPSNIALVKYWGKKGNQQPLNPSLSITLSNCYSEFSVEYKKAERPGIKFTFQNRPHDVFENRIVNYIHSILEQIPILKSLYLIIDSQNSFPHSAGIASSASAFSALALCLCSIEKEMISDGINSEEFYRKASSLARLGSGSSCRSIYGGWVLWGETPGVSGSSNDYALPVSNLVHGNFRHIYDSILVIDSNRKPISSSVGHKLMQSNPFTKDKIKTGKDNITKLLYALKNGNEISLSKIIENEAANLHAMFLTSNPPFILITPKSLMILNILARFKKDTGLNFSYTMDAGPNIHLLYNEKVRTKMIHFIHSELKEYCENGMWIDDKIGYGPQLIKN